VATDYDAPRTTDTDEVQEHNLTALKAQRPEAAADLGDDADLVEDGFDLPVGDLTGEDLTVRLVPRQADEFTCTVCYLVHHRSQLGDRQQTYTGRCRCKQEPWDPRRRSRSAESGLAVSLPSGAGTVLL